MKNSSLSARKTSRYSMLYNLLCSCCALSGARCKEDPLLQYKEPPLVVDGDDLNRDQDRPQPEKSHLDLRVLCTTAPIQEEPLQPADLASPWVTDPVTRALRRRLEPFNGPRASRRRPGCRLLGTREG